MLEVKENRTDYIFLLEDNTLLHLEFATAITKGILNRFALYDARLISRDDRHVNTAVVYSGRVETAPSVLKRGSITYRVTNVYMKSFDGDLEYQRLRDKIENNETLTEEDTLKLVFLPLMKSENSEDEMAIQAAELAKEIKGEIKTLIIGAIVAITDKFMAENYKKKLLEVLRMTQIEQWIREEGKIEGRLEGRLEGKLEGKIEIAKAALKEGADIEFVAKITGLSNEVILNLKRELN